MDALPLGLRDRLDGASVSWLGVDGRVASCTGVDGRRCVLERGDPVAIAAEVDRLRWLAQRGPTPGVVAHTEADGEGWLVTAALEGSPATAGEHQFDVVATAHAAGRALRRFHDTVPAAGCPFDRRVQARLDAAAANVAAGRVDPSRIDAAYRRLTVERLLAELRRQPPDEPADDLVVTHGSPVLSHLVLSATGRAGWIGLDRMGVTDRHGDLATAARDLARTVGPATLPPFYDGYGIEAPDPRRIDWYALADQLS